MLDLKIDDFSGMIPVISIFAFKGRGNGGIEAKPFFESEITCRIFSIFFGRGSLEVRKSLARLDKVSTRRPCRRINSRRSEPPSD